jgi:DNA-binding transcriptional MerR regulator
MPQHVLNHLDADVVFSTPEACRMARVSFRQIDYWVRTGLIEPDRPATGSGSQRRFTAEQVRDVAMIGRLRELGVRHEAIEEVLACAGDGVNGALIVIGADVARVVGPLDVADAVIDAHGAAVVVSRDALRVVTDEGDDPRCSRPPAPKGRGSSTAD